jgi:hypothetical protein
VWQENGNRPSILNDFPSRKLLQFFYLYFFSSLKLIYYSFALEIEKREERENRIRSAAAVLVP